MSSWSGSLRIALSSLARRYRDEQGLPAYESLGENPVVLFEKFAGGSRHGNFRDASYAAILASDQWRSRLQKTHQRTDALPPEKRGSAKELDSCTSSDSLLMNIFCHPNVDVGRVLSSLGLDPKGSIEFGVPGCVPLATGQDDATELDMRIGPVYFEAKLTEPDFTSKSKQRVRAYSGFEDVFGADLLPQTESDYSTYQLIRNVLAAHHHNTSFVLLLDARRPDLLRYWWNTMGAVRPGDLRARCHFLLWQEIAHAAPKDLRHFLDRKYGIA